MRTNAKTLPAKCILIAMMAMISGCKDQAVSNVISEGVPSSDVMKETLTLTVPPSSDGLEFESNGDGTCTITGIGTCGDTDLVIPTKSPDGDTVTLIAKYAFYDLEDIDSITFSDYNYEIDKYAFQYGEFTSLNVIGGAPIFKESAFSSCEDLGSITFANCTIQIGEYAFFSCGKDADLTFSNCTGTLDKRAFQYSDLLNLTINDCELDIEESVFSSCENFTSISITDSTVGADEYSFFSCGDSANVEISNCSLVLDDRAFQYSSLGTLSITGAALEIGKSTFSNCEDLSNVTIDSDSVFLGEYAFFGCDDLTDVSICADAGSDDTIEIDDRAFQYCEKLKSVIIGKGAIDIGEYAFSGGSDDLTLSIAGKKYTADSIKNGFPQ